MPKQKNMLMAQSGGPTSVINSSVVGAFYAALDTGFDNIYAAAGGIQGVLDGRMVDLKTTGRHIIDGLKLTPSAGLGSCRYKMPKDIGHADYQKVFETFDRYGIGYFFYNGGNDSMDTCDKINDYAVRHGVDLKVMGIPKTIDNDLVGTDHCPGFGSAAKFLNSELMMSAYDCYTYTTPTIILMETMGRHAGWLAASTACATFEDKRLVDRIYLPEAAFDMDGFLKDTEKLFKEKGMVYIVVSEGIRDAGGEFLLSGSSVNDKFGHAQLGGVSSFLQQKIAGSITSRCKILNPGIMQRCAFHMVSERDLNESFDAGYYAVKEAAAGRTGYMVGFDRVQDNPYICHYCLTPLGDVANSEKTVPKEWIIDDNDVSNDIVRYTTPLMQGEARIAFKNGLPCFTRLPRNFI